MLLYLEALQFIKLREHFIKLRELFVKVYELFVNLYNLLYARDCTWHSQ